MSTFLLTWLGEKYGALDATVFLREQPGEWLVLEGTGGAAARAWEPVATRLALRKDRARYTLGRDPASDLVVNDPGVALSHLVLQQDEDGAWTVRRGEEAPATLDGLPLGDFPVPLGSGAKLELGSVRLTYYAGADLHGRLRGMA